MYSCFSVRILGQKFLVAQTHQSDRSDRSDKPEKSEAQRMLSEFSPPKSLEIPDKALLEAILTNACFEPAINHHDPDDDDAEPEYGDGRWIS